jgi:hypothetical protein
VRLVGVQIAILAIASGVSAAGEVVVSVSPATVQVGEPVEVLVRTFIPFDRSGALPLAEQRSPYPGASGFYEVLYPWDDYPFDVVAQHEDGTEVRMVLARDAFDSTLWRGTVALPKAGAWTIWVRNFQHQEPGSTAVVTAQDATASLGAGQAAAVAALLGLLVGILVGRFTSRRRS